MTLYNLKHSEVILISGGLRCECFLTQRYGNPQPSRIKDRFRDRTGGLLKYLLIGLIVALVDELLLKF